MGIFDWLFGKKEKKGELGLTKSQEDLLANINVDDLKTNMQSENNLEFYKSKDFINAINNISKSGVDIKIELYTTDDAFYEELLRDGEWNGKHFAIFGTRWLRNAQVAWEDDLDSLLKQLEGKEINELGDGFFGWGLVGDDGGGPAEANGDAENGDSAIKWFSASYWEQDKNEITLSDKELKEFEELSGEGDFGEPLSPIESLWNNWEEEEENILDLKMDKGAMFKIVVNVGDDSFVLKA